MNIFLPKRQFREDKIKTTSNLWLLLFFSPATHTLGHTIFPVQSSGYLCVRNFIIFILNRQFRETNASLQIENSKTTTLCKRASQNLSRKMDINRKICQKFYQIPAFVDYLLPNHDPQFFQFSTALPSGLKKKMWTSFFRVGRLQKTIWISKSYAFVDFQPSNAGFRIQNSSFLFPWYFVSWKGKHLHCESAVSGNQKLLQIENSQAKTLSKKTSKNLSRNTDINKGIYQNFYQILAFVDYWPSNARIWILNFPLKYSEFFWVEKRK